MSKKPYLITIMGIAILSCASLDIQKADTITIELEGNPTTGYTWVYTMVPEGIVREVSNEYIPDRTSGRMAGAGGRFIFTFEAIGQGETDLVFSYLRPWETGIPPANTKTYKLIVDEQNKLTIF